MHNPIEIALRGIPSSDEVERQITEEAQQLKNLYDRVRSCRVLAEVQQGENRQGAQFAVQLIITLPGTEIVVNREHPDDVLIAVRDAFAAAGLQIMDHMRRHSAEPRSRSGTGGSPDI